MIAASALLVVIALVTLIIGIFQSGLGLIWVSIASSVLAAIFLLLGVVQGRPKIVVAGGPQPGGGWGDSPTGLLEREPDAYGQAYQDEEFEPEPEMPVEPAPRPARAASRPAARPAARTPAGQASVVVIPDRDKFHKASCRYAKNAAAMTMPKSEARREGYKPCGVCKP